MPKKNKKKRSSSAAVHRLAPPSLSRRTARLVTTHFHQMTRARANILALGLATTEIDRQLEASRATYQRASQVSTSFHSTSKWVLGCLAQSGWLYGRSSTTSPTGQRPTRLLEVGAINTELLDAALPKDNGNQKHQLEVRAIDIHSMHPDRIEEADFLTLPIEMYDVIVCSMVLNCVATAEDRGRMLVRLYRSLAVGGWLYLTIPKTCLLLSPYLDRTRFEAILQDIGFRICEHAKESPKLAYFVLSRDDESSPISAASLEDTWGTNRRIFRGQKFKNDFSVVLRLSFCDEA